jgi:Putative Ig domain
LLLHRVSPQCSRLQKIRACVVRKFLILAALAVLFAIVTGCNSLQPGQSAAEKPTQASQVKVNVAPASINLTAGSRQQFSAIVNGTANLDVTWSASAGTISNTGVFEAPALAKGTQISIVATSAADSTQRASSIVTIDSATSLIRVNVAPASISLAAGSRQQFTATVDGTSNTAVTWSASAGTITGAGVFAAPSLPKGSQINIVATSVADPTLRATSVVTIASAETGAPLAIAKSSLAQASTNASYSESLSASGGTPPYNWSISTGALPSGFMLHSPNGQVSGTTTQAGTFSFTAVVTDSASHSASQPFTLLVSSSPGNNTSGFDGPAELPRVYLNTTLANTPAPGATISVPANGNLQNALNSANCGDTIQLQAGATYNGGVFMIPNKPCDDGHWIIIRTSAPDSSLPPEGTRMTPCYVGVTSLPGRPVFTCSSTEKVLATINYGGTGDGPIQFAVGANHYRFLGLEVTRTANNHTPVGALISAVQNGTMDSIVLDRLYLHGTPGDETRRGVRLSGGTNTAVQDSYLSDFHCDVGGTCVDSQAVSGGTGDQPGGPYKIVDNFLEAAGENILFGGDHATYTPADIQVSQNHLFKPMFWLKGQPGYSVPVIVKNHFELKNAQRVLVDSNIMDDNWGGFSQFGFSVVLTPKNQDIDGKSVCPICLVTDVTIRYATISHVAGAFMIANVITPVGGVPFEGRRYSIHDVIVDDLNGVTYNGHGTFAEVSTVAQPLLQDVQINHVTAFPNKTLLNVGAPNSVQMPGFVLTNSILGAGQTPVWSTGANGTENCAYYDVPIKTVGLCFANPYFSHNAILESPYERSSWPGGNFFYSTSAIGFVNFDQGNGGNYQLLPSSPAIGAATDGTNLGADVAAVLSDIAGVQ